MTIDSYGNFIKERRKELSLSQNELGKVLNCSFQAISRYEKDKVKIDLSLIGILSRILKVDITSFINKESEKNNDCADTNYFDINRFSNTLIYLRDASNLSQKDFANKIAISNKKISKWENGTSLPKIEEFIKIKEFYNLPYEHLYFGKFDLKEITPKQYKRKRFFELATNVI